MSRKTRYLWGKDSTGELKSESHPSNYKYWRKKNVFIMHGNGGGARLVGLYWHIILREKNSNLRIPSLNDNEALDSAC